MTRSLPRLADLGTDLLVTTRPRRIFTLSLPYVGIAPLFAGAWIAGWRWLTPLIVFGIFVAVVTSTHDVVHRSLGLGGRTTEVALFLLGAVLLESGHAYRATHLQHHRTFPSHEDPEGYPANLSALGALLYGPVFLVRLWLWAFRRATRGQRIWLAAEAALPFAAVTVGAVFSRGLLVYAVMVIVGSWVYPVADHPPAAPPLRGHAAHADPHAARTHRPRPVPGADVPFGASPVPSGAEPQSPATRAEARPCTHRGGREALESALNRWRHARRPESVSSKRRLAIEGYGGTTARSIARTGGFAPGVIYYHFEDLEALLVAALRHASQKRRRRYEEVLGSCTDATELLARLRELYAEDMSDQGHIDAVQELFTASATSPRLREELLAHVESWTEFAAAAVGRLVEGTALQHLVPNRELGMMAVAMFLGIQTLTHLDGDRSRVDSLFNTPNQSRSSGTLSPAATPPPPTRRTRHPLHPHNRRRHASRPHQRRHARSFTVLTCRCRPDTRLPDRGVPSSPGRDRFNAGH